MRKLVALVVSMAFALGVGLAVPQAFAQAPAPKDEKKGEMMEKKAEKKSAKKKAEKKKPAKKMEQEGRTRRKKRSSAAAAWGATASGWRPSAVSGSPSCRRGRTRRRGRPRFLPGSGHPRVAVAHGDLDRLRLASRPPASASR